MVREPAGGVLTPSSSPRAGRWVARAAGAVGVLFGIATLIVGSRVLSGASEPGFVVFRPLLVYNTLMGAAYVAAGLVIWRDLRRGARAAAAIFALNLLVLGAILAVYVSGGGVAVQSLRAMSLRTAVWLGVLLAVRRAGCRAA